MGPARSVIAAMSALFVLLPTLATGAEPEIACRELLRQRITVTVMGSDGLNPTIIFENDKFKRGSTMPKWSPGGEWITFRRGTNPEVDQISGIYKIRPSGTDMTQILCASGTRPGGTFSSPYYPQWSPDGQWILVYLGHEADTGSESWLGIVPTNVEPDGCYSPLIHLYAPVVNPTPGDGWIIVGYAPTWTDDGSKIAFFEQYWIEDSSSDYRLQVLDLDDSGAVPTVVAKHPIELPEDLQQVMIDTGVDWQRGGGSILLFDTHDGVDKVTWLDLDLETHEVLGWGHLTEGWSANWSPNNDRIVYNLDLELRVASVGYGTDGAPTILDSTAIYPDHRVGCLWPDWKRDSLPIACGSDADCDDANPCTDNVCNGGLCTSSNNTQECDDGNPCTSGDLCSGGSCSGEPIVDGFGEDCTGWCCDGACWEGANSCEPDPVDCSLYFDKKPCNAEPTCRWDNRNKVCVPN